MGKKGGETLFYDYTFQCQGHLLKHYLTQQCNITFHPLVSPFVYKQYIQWWDSAEFGEQIYDSESALNLGLPSIVSSLR